MTPRERIFTVLKGEQPDQVPWFGDLDYWANSLIKRGLKPKDFISSDDYIRWHRELGVGFYLQGYFPFKQVFNNCMVKEWYDGYKHNKVIITPIGSVRECWEYIPTSFSEAPVEHFTFASALGGLLFGYDTVIVNGAMPDLVKYFQLSPAIQGWTVSSALPGSILETILKWELTILINLKHEKKGISN